MHSQKIETATTPESKKNWRRRIVVYLVTMAVVVGAGVAVYFHNHSSHNRQAETNLVSAGGQYDSFLKQTSDSLISLHQESDGGWRFQSQIQAPHYQTDRDVGAASVGMGFLAEAEANPNDPQWLDAAKHTADWLITVSSQDNNGGRYWHDYVDGSNKSPDVYTSFDDGAIGIGDFFWQLYEKTGDVKYKEVALQTLQWTFSQAEPISQDGISGYQWKWDVTDPNSPYYMGMGEGTVGIVNSLATYYQRLQHSDPKMAAECRKYMEGGLNYIDIVRQNLKKSIGSDPTIPETGVVGRDGDTVLDSGYLSGAAGDAYMYLHVSEATGDKSALKEAEQELGWLSDPKHGPLVNINNNEVAWRIELEPQGGNNNKYATGVEEGNAGIGWTFLQAYGETGKKGYLTMAEKAANWLLDENVVIKDSNGGLSWHEDEHPASLNAPHVNLNNGAAGIGEFLYDVYKADGNKKYLIGAQGAVRGIMNAAKHKGNITYWVDNSGNTYQNDPSWHWGDAGVIGAVERINGGSRDYIGEEPALTVAPN